MAYLTLQNNNSTSSGDVDATAISFAGKTADEMNEEECTALERKLRDCTIDPSLGRIRCMTCRILVPPVSAGVGTQVNLKAQLFAGAHGGPLVGKALHFSIDGKAIGVVKTDNQGMALLPVTQTKLEAGQYTVIVEFPGEIRTTMASGSGTLTIREGGQQ